MSYIRTLTLPAAALALLAAPHMATAQWSTDSGPTWNHIVEISTSSKSGKAHLWLPTGDPVALLVCVDNYAEEAMVRDPLFREFLGKTGIALLHYRPRYFLFTFDPNGEEAEGWNQTFEKLTAAGAPEGLKKLPLFVFGHSAAAPWAEQTGFALADQVAGVIHYKSGAILGFEPTWGNDAIATVPFLAINGEYEEFGPNGPLKPGDPPNLQAIATAADLKKWRARGFRVAQAVLPGESHYDWSPAARELVESFIRGSLAYRHETADGNASPVTGWWVGAAGESPQPETASSPQTLLIDDTRWWAPDLATAGLLLRHQTGTGRQKQTLTFANRTHSNDGKDIINGQWDAQKKVLTVSATSSSKLPINTFRLLRGPALQISANKFQLLDPLPPGSQDSLEIIAIHPGNETWSPAGKVARAFLQ